MSKHRTPIDFSENENGLRLTNLSVSETEKLDKIMRIIHCDAGSLVARRYISSTRLADRSFLRLIQLASAGAIAFPESPILLVTVF